MPATPLRAEAFCAVGPDQAIDIDLVRRSVASAQHSAVVTKGEGRQWPALARIGWTVVPVRIYGGSAVPEELVDQGDLPKPRGAAVPKSRSRKPEQGAHPGRAAASLLRC
jgi:hypothetical protein